LLLGDDRTKILTFLDDTVIYPEEFNATSYESSAESFSGKYNDGSAFVTIALSVGAAVLAIPFCSFVIKPVLIIKKYEGKE
jgi:hypothetical protein